MIDPEKARVLIVEDNEATSTLITAVLHRDFEVELATDGQEAMEKLRTSAYGAIVLDLRMPGSDGFTVLDFLKSNTPAKLRNVVVVTAAVSKRDLDRARAYGICDVVTKPFDVETLFDAVRKCVREGGPIFCAPVILLLADLLRHRWM